MAATTRWVQYEVTASGTASVGDTGCRGTRGYAVAKSSLSGDADKVTIGPTTNKLYLSINGEAGIILTLVSGIDLDPRFVAKDISEKIHSSGAVTTGHIAASCKWEGGAATTTTTEGNAFKIYSGSLGSGSQVVVASGSNNANAALGFGTKKEQGGLAGMYGGGSYIYDGTVSLSGTYHGFLDETYTILISRDAGPAWAYSRGIAPAIQGGSQGYAGNMTTGGVYTGTSDDTYVISIDATNGTTMGAGTGAVPIMSWTSTGSDHSTPEDTELLYVDHWYNVGKKGLMVKFSDAVFDTAVTSWTILCYAASYVESSNSNAPVGSAQYVWASDRGDNSTTPMTTSSGMYTRLGSRGLYIRFDNATTNLYAKEVFTVCCTGPTPENPAGYNITSLNYGNVTVSSDSPVKCVFFEVMSGAVEVSTVKFGLQNNGSFLHHPPSGNLDTLFRLGTVGPTNTAGPGDTNGYEWYPNVAATDIDSETEPSFLYLTKANLLEVSTADESEDIGSWGLMADPIWLNIRLGTSETGANSSINQRLYFDYS